MSTIRPKQLLSAVVAAAILGLASTPSLALGPAQAQTVPDAGAGANPIPPTTPPDKISPDPIPSPADPSLSRKLDQSNGVITPPKGVDPGIVTPPPEGAAPMPVIPPPGTPGNQPNVQPK
jgi:hypothetical protein